MDTTGQWAKTNKIVVSFSAQPVSQGRKTTTLVKTKMETTAPDVQFFDEISWKGWKHGQEGVLGTTRGPFNSSFWRYLSLLGLLFPQDPILKKNNPTIEKNHVQYYWKSSMLRLENSISLSVLYWPWYWSILISDIDHDIDQYICLVLVLIMILIDIDPTWVLVAPCFLSAKV